MNFTDIFQRKKRTKSEKTQLERDAEDSYEVHEDSDLPVTEKHTKQVKIRK